MVRCLQVLVGKLNIQCGIHGHVMEEFTFPVESNQDEH